MKRFALRWLLMVAFDIALVLHLLAIFKMTEYDPSYYPWWDLFWAGIYLVAIPTIWRFVR